MLSALQIQCIARNRVDLCCRERPSIQIGSNPLLQCSLQSGVMYVINHESLQTNGTNNPQKSSYAPLVTTLYSKRHWSRCFFLRSLSPVSQLWQPSIWTCFVRLEIFLDLCLSIWHRVWVYMCVDMLIPCKPYKGQTWYWKVDIWLPTFCNSSGKSECCFCVGQISREEWLDTM